MGIMRNNVDKVLERDAKLTDLDDRAGQCRKVAKEISVIVSSLN